MLQRTLEKKLAVSAINLGPNQRTLKIFFKAGLIWDQVNALGEEIINF